MGKYKYVLWFVFTEAAVMTALGWLSVQIGNELSRTFGAKLWGFTMPGVTGMLFRCLPMGLAGAWLAFEPLFARGAGKAQKVVCRTVAFVYPLLPLLFLVNRSMPGWLFWYGPLLKYNVSLALPCQAVFMLYCLARLGAEALEGKKPRAGAGI